MHDKNMISAREHINKVLEDKRKLELDTIRLISSWHPSKLGSCLCGVYLERRGVEPDKDFDPRTLGVFDMGHRFEEAIMSLLAESENLLSIERQVRIEDETLNVTGYADAVLMTLEGYHVLEVKSKHSKAFWYMLKKGEGAQLHHRMQLWLYLHILKIESGSILYISKDDGTLVEFPVSLHDEELRDLVLGELSILNKSWAEGLPPEPVRDPKDWRYKYCRWHKKCLKQSAYLQTNES